jgi:phosphoglycerate dehydrogenase-like enzyme
MSDLPKVVFATRRSLHHQQATLAAVPTGVRVVMLSSPTRADLLAELHDAEILMSERSGVIDAGLIAAAPRLRLIQRLGSLVYDIDLDAARDAGVMVCSQPVTGCVRVAEHMIMQMLALVRRLPVVSRLAAGASDWGRPSRRTDANTFAYNWTRQTQIGSIYGRTVGILGMGEIGVELARRLAAFVPAQVLYHKRTRLPESVEAGLGITYAFPDAMVAAADFLCVLLPYSADTDQSLDAATFAAMKPGALVAHAGSGSVIDETALADALQSGHLGGAALDTFEWEPLRPDNPLVALARDPSMNVLLTPHIGSGTTASGRASSWANVRRYLAGEPLIGRVV